MSYMHTEIVSELVAFSPRRSNAAAPSWSSVCGSYNLCVPGRLVYLSNKSFLDGTKSRISHLALIFRNLDIMRLPKK